jgi:DNA-binding response OmpR family regulator
LQSPESTSVEGLKMTASETNLPDLHSLGVQQPIVLVAEDEVMIRNLVTILLQRKGHIVLSASDGQEGLEISRKYPGTIDLVITDVKMPRLNGLDLCTHLLEERPGIKVIVMTGEEMSEIVVRNVNLPFLPKPFDGDALLERVQAILGVPVLPKQSPSRPLSE